MLNQIAADTRVQNRRRDHRVRAAKCIQQRDEDEAAGRRADKVEKVDPVYPLDGFRDGERHDRARQKTARRYEIDERKRTGAGLPRARHDNGKRKDNGHSVHGSHPAEFPERISRPGGNYV